MFSLLIYLQFALVIGGMTYVYAKTRDVFHPLFLILPTFGFIYGIMPFNLDDGRTLISTSRPTSSCSSSRSTARGRSPSSAAG
jgi:hypothetical protein